VIDDFLTAQASDFFAAVTAGLDAAGVTWERAPRLVRGLDYYRHTAFEFVTDALGAQGTVLAGGRYDGLVEALGGPHTPAIGWAAGIERLSMLIDAPVISQPIAVVAENASREADAVRFAVELRRNGVPAEAYVTGSARKRFQRALKGGAPALVSFDLRDGGPTGNFKVVDEASADAAKAGELFQRFGADQPA
jgi:histidyl-tRNA synthetase